MTRSILLGAAAIAAAATLPALPAQAQGDATIVIEGPRIERSGRLGQDRVATASSVVYYDDLALDTSYGRDALHDRVKAAARETCDLLSDATASDRSFSAESQCVRKAVNGARDQVNAAIASYYYASIARFYYG